MYAFNACSLCTSSVVNVLLWSLGDVYINVDVFMEKGDIGGVIGVIGDEWLLCLKLSN